MAHKLQGLLLIFAFFLAGVGFIGFQTNLEITASMKAMYEQRLLPIQLAYKGQSYNKEVESLAIRSLVNNPNQEMLLNYIDQMEEYINHKDVLLVQYGKFKVDEQEQKWLSHLHGENNQIRLLLHNVKEQIKQKQLENSTTQEQNSYKYDLRSILTHTTESSKYFQAIIDNSQEQASNHYQEGKKLSNFSLSITAIIVVISLILAFLLGIVLNKIFTRPLQKILDAVEMVERGQLSEVEPLPVRSRDEIGKLSKGFNEMIVALQTNLRRINDYSQAMLFQAYHDALTELPNRRHFQERLEKLIEHCQREKQRMAVLFIDLDQFKEINDTLGHSAGDILLQSVAQRLAVRLESVDLFARIGGDEFTVLISNIEQDCDAGIIALAIQEELELPFQVQGNVFNVSSSIGISIYPDDGEDIESLLQAADTAMYQAKRLGRNTFRFYSATMHEKIRERRLIEKELRQAIEENQLSLVYQPKADMKGQQILGLEALVRWNHPELGWISPGTFIPIAEETGLIHPLGKWLLHSVCVQNRSWQEKGLPPIPMAVNLSPYEIRQEKIVEHVQEVLAETGLEPQWLELEITEGSLLEDSFATLKTLEQLKSLGIRIAIDDFGTGYSSLAYINRFPIDALKIDKSFVDKIVLGAKDAKLVDAIIGIANIMDLTVIAEGVEKEEQLKLLESFGCHQFQGYFFSRPLPADAMEEMLRQHNNKPLTGS
ncbi:EAL domain-containing protein [Heliorestis convoluta]|nr:EAL domain-containing protein [Heliorestis convoluta]